MTHLFDGLRAATLVALLLTIWSFLGVSSSIGDESESAGMLYVLSAFGILGMVQLVYGFGLGVTTWAWRSLVAFLGGLDEPEADQRFASLLLTVPIAAVGVGAVTGIGHLLVTASFVRAGFQALGLVAIATVGTLAVVALSPLVFRAVAWAMARAPLPSGPARATQTALIVLGLVAIVGATGMYVYASGLQVFSPRLLQMFIVAAFLLPTLMWAMQRFSFERPVYTYGVPIAGAVLIVSAFVGAASWTSSSATMRAATLQHSAIVGLVAKALQPLADSDGDGYASAWGGNDCDDTNPKIYPGAPDIPGNGIDESCSGADAELPQGQDHPSRKAVSRALDSAVSAVKREVENIPDPPKNVVFLLIDTLRIDHLGYAGYERDTSPNIDALAAESTAFLNAYATSPHTPRSIPAMFFGRYPSRTQWRGGQYNYPRVMPENTSFAEILEENGHRNIAHTSHHYFQEKRGVGQGFETWNNDGFLSISESNDDIAAPRIWERAEPEIDRLAATDDPFTLVIHFFEPHARWIRHDEYDFGGGKTPEERHKNAYDSEIAYVDNYVGKVVQKLKDTGLWDSSIVVLVSDHGEAFNEHGYFFHGQTIYNEVVRVPMLIRVPGWFSRRVETPVSIVDIPPTIVDLMGYPAASDWDGQSLLPLMVGDAPSQNRPIFVELLPYTSWKEHHKAVVVDDLKFISVLSAGTEELYDLAADPGETKNLASERPEDAARMRQLIEHFQSPE